PAMATAIRPIGHEDRLSLVEHLDELRTRLIICVITVGVALGVAFWQNHALLSVLNEPLKETTKSAAKHASGPIGESARVNFVLPAFSPRERRVALPLMAMVPALFVAGVVFAYFLVLPAAIGFLQNFNNGEFDVLVQARSLYSFSILTLIIMGVLFQLPVGVLALTRLGIVTPAQLRRHWRYAVVIISVIAVLLPGTDPITTCIE